MKKIIPLSLMMLFIIQSCAIFKTAKKDMMVGDFNITILDTPYGDVPIVLKVTKSEDTYSSELVGEGQLDGVFQVDSTEVTDNTILVEADAMGTPMSLELKVNENEISGTVMDFEIKGSRIVE